MFGLVFALLCRPDLKILRAEQEGHLSVSNIKKKIKSLLNSSISHEGATTVDTGGVLKLPSRHFPNAAAQHQTVAWPPHSPCPAVSGAIHTSDISANWMLAWQHLSAVSTATL